MNTSTPALRLVHCLLRWLLFGALPLVASPWDALQPIARWQFNQTNELLRASPGDATLSVLGGLRIAPASGSGSSDPATNSDFALQLSGFPKPGSPARTAGLEITASTAGFRDVALRFDVRASSTASRRLRVLYSTDGHSLSEGPAFDLPGGSTFTNGLTVDFSGIAGVGDNPTFRVRLVSDWDGEAYAGAGGNYSSAGTWRIDHLRLLGTPSADAAEGPAPGDPQGAIILTAQPRSLEVPEGGGALFRVAALGRGPLSYQWCLDGRPLHGANRRELRIAQVYRDHVGLYTVRISDGRHSILSEEASLSFLDDPTILPIRVLAEPGPRGSIRLNWSTPPGAAGTLLRSQGWDGLPVVIGRGLTGGTLEDTPPVGGPYFYWVELPSPR